MDPDQNAPLRAIRSGFIVVSSVIKTEVHLNICSSGKKQTPFLGQISIGRIRMNLQWA